MAALLLSNLPVANENMSQLVVAKLSAMTANLTRRVQLSVVYIKYVQYHCFKGIGRNESMMCTK
jgi:hypothetical protein